MFKKIAAIILVTAMAATLFSAEVFAAGSKKKSVGFIHTKGSYIVDETDRKYLIKAAAIGNAVWENPKTPPKERIDQTVYEDLATMGFNAVRFYINYHLFESDKAPYKYRDVGFEWLDRNLEMAKKSNIRFIINMHVPQGGYQSEGKGEALWTDQNNRKRLISLWSKIAERYANDPYILGYGIVNEPTPLAKDVNEGLEKWRSLAQDITDAVRKKDKNHIIFVEKINGVKIKSTGMVTWASEIDPMHFYPKMKDNNYAYEFHTYDPGAYANQGTDMYPERYTYPGQSKLVGNFEWRGSEDAPIASPDKKGEWQYVETNAFKVTDPKIKAVGATFGASNIGKNGVCYADDIVIYEYDENGNLINTLPCETTDHKGDFSYWSMDETGTGNRENNFGRKDKTCIRISGSESIANMGMIKVMTVQGHSYKAAGYVMIESAASDPWVYVSLGQYDSDWNTFIGLDKDYLRDNIVNVFTAQCRKDNVPAYCGEMGAVRGCFEDDRGGGRWVSDNIDIFIENNIGFTYHDYFSENFGIYYYNYGIYPITDAFVCRNEDLEKVFVEKLGGKYAPPKFFMAARYIPSFKVRRSGSKYKLSWNKITNSITKYQIQYSDDGGKTYKKTVNVAKNKTSKTLSLDAKKKYVFRMRTYLVYNGITYYGSWSKPVSVK